MVALEGGGAREEGVGIEGATHPELFGWAAHCSLDCEALQARGSVVLGEAEVGNLARRVSAVWKLESRGAKRVADFGKRMFCGRGPVDILYDTLTYRRASPCCDVPLRAVL